jgi:hypothetical protein
MSQINQLSELNPVSSGDQIPVFNTNNGDTRRLSIGNLLAFFQQQFASPTVSVSTYVPTTGFSITVPTPVSQQQWMLIQPLATLAAGTITLPLNTSTPDGTEVLITTTQQITSLTISLNGASAIYGEGLTQMTAGQFRRLRYYQSFNSWYRIA